MKLKKFNCCICGKEEDPTHWVQDCGEKLMKHQMCFECNHWREQHELDHTTRGEHGWAVINGSHYTLHPHTDGIRGMYGRTYKIEFNDGTVVECNNLWHQGDLNRAAKYWRELMPDNAVIR